MVKNQHTVFTLLNTAATISHIICYGHYSRVAIIRGQHLLQCNNDRRGYYSKTRQFYYASLYIIYGTNNCISYICTYYSVPS